MLFFQGVLPISSSLHRQFQGHNFVLSKPNDTNTATMRLHYHAIFSIVTIVDWSSFINDQSHLDKGLPQPTSYVYRNEISCTLFNLESKNK